MNKHFVPHLFKGSEHSEDLLAVPHACYTSRFSLSGFLRYGYKNISGDRRGVKLSIISILPTKSVSAEGILTLNHRNIMKSFSSFSR